MYTINFVITIITTVIMQINYLLGLTSLRVYKHKKLTYNSYYYLKKI